MPDLVFNVPGGFASAAQGTKANTAIQSVKVNGAALTPDGSRAVNVLAATPAQGTKADSAIQAVKVNGVALTPDGGKAVNIPVPDSNPFLISAGIMPPTGVLEVNSTTGSNHYVLGPIKHIFYRAGANMVDLTDSDGSGVPDYIEDMALQYLVAYHVYADIIGLRSPFLSPQHAGKNYQYIRVLYTADNGSTSLSYRAVQPDTDGIGYTPIAQAISASPYNATPTHELMHQFQYGYSYFGNGWYLEGMARWSEDIIKNIPYVVKSREELLSMLRVPSKWAALSALEYTASEHFWRPFGHCFEAETQVILNPNDPYLKLRLHDGSYVIHDDWDFSGMRLLPLFFQRLEMETNRCYDEQGYAPSWSDAETSAAINSKYIRWAVEDMLVRL
jgi:hypothetical protein